MSSSRSKKLFGLASLAAGAPAATGQTPEIAISGLDAWAIRSSPEAVPRLVIALRTNTGVTGYGETSAGADPASSVAEAERHANALVGKDAMASMAVRVSLSATAPAIRGAVDIALLDVRGKIADAPVYDLLAGRTRDKARRQRAEDAYRGSIGKWKRDVGDEEAVDAFYAFREAEIVAMAEEFLRENGIEPVWKSFG